MHVFSLPNWKDFVDILIISFILHRLFLFMRGTMAFQVTVGLIFLWLFQELARTAGFVLTSWFFRGIGAVAVLVIVVVFHNEIREILVQTNPVRFLLGRSRQARDLSYQVITRAVFRLAKRGTGALIVIQNRDELGSNAREGVPFDANLVPEGLEAIFAKDSPVHDGATIIRGNRIAKVGAFLPLSQREGLPHYFGTRHRAAIGLSEVSDAVVLVVSEERGEISLVHRHNFQLIQDPDQLERALRELLLSDHVVSGYLGKPKRAWLTQAKGLLLTFFLVSAFWGIYAGRQFSLMPLRAPVHFRDIPEGLQLRDASADEVEVQVSGKRGLVGSLNPQQVLAFLNLDDIDAGEHTLALRSDNIVLPPGLEVKRIVPSSITVHMDKMLEKMVEIKPDLVGPPPDGLAVEAVRVKPASVRIRGPFDRLRDLTTLETEPIILQDLKVGNERASLEAPLDLASLPVQFPEKEEREVKVNIRFRSKEHSEVRGVRYYLVQKGDTLYEISHRHGISVEALRRLNNLGPEEYIHPGQELKIHES